MRLIIGLGNPGREYVSTPHNMGFLAVDEIAARAGVRVTRPEAKSYIGHGQIAGQDVVLAKPQTMMNLSGIAVRMLLERFDCAPSDLMLLTDDFALPWGMLRIRERGSSGGHNGLKSVIGAIGTDEFLRIRMGVQPERHWGDMADYVLCSMTAEQRQIVSQMVAAAAEAVELILSQGPSRAMSRFNRRVDSAGAIQI